MTPDVIARGQIRSARVRVLCDPHIRFALTAAIALEVRALRSCGQGSTNLMQWVDFNTEVAVAGMIQFTNRIDPNFPTCF